MLLTHSYWPDQSPPQRRWSSFVREFQAAGWRVDVVTPVSHFPNGKRTERRADAGYPWGHQRGEHGERIRRVPYLRHAQTRVGRFIDNLYTAVLSVPAAMMQRRPEVVVVTAPSLPILAAGHVVAKIFRVPLVVEMRDAWPDLARDARLVQGQVKSLAEKAVEFVQNKANLVVTVTEGFAKTLLERGVAEVATVPNGLDLRSVPLLPAPVVDKEQLDVLYLGNHGESQRLELMVQAAAKVGSRMHLHMVGYGVARPGLIQLAREIGAPVTFHPPVKREAVLEAYKLADSCIVSLRDDWKSFETTIPSKTYEVLAVGRHVTALVRGEAARIISDSDAGDVVPSTVEAIAQLWNDLADDRSRLDVGSRGRDWVEDHAEIRASAKHYMELIDELLARSSGDR
ncbi:glycosyltransferase family 4 protein [Pseudarthrobacter sp. J1763]|uniref:glycosyltransferase family 4 protein n=1 Tax=Pseudarthrobacter sp. J1763 TaxID=3420445 RepID=UPI003D297ABD